MDKKERRKMLNVEDRPLEVGVTLNNILTFLVLSVMSWVGYNINSMKDQMAEVVKETAVTKNTVTNLEGRLDRHIDNRDIHYYAKRKGE